MLKAGRDVLLGIVLDVTVRTCVHSLVPLLPYAWFLILIWLTYDLINSKSVKKLAHSGYQRWGIKHRMITYLIVFAVGGCLLCFYWWGISKVFAATPNSASVDNSTSLLEVRKEIYQQYEREKTRTIRLYGRLAFDDLQVASLIGQQARPDLKNNQDLSNKLDTAIARQYASAKDKEDIDADFNKVLAEIRTNFPASARLDTLIKDASNQRSISTVAPKGLPTEEHVKWIKDREISLNAELNEKINQPLESLSQYLNSFIQGPESAGEAMGAPMKSAKSLHDLFLHDFGDLSARLPGYPETNYPGGPEKIEALLLIDLNTNAEWMSFYIPLSTGTYEISKSLSDSYRQILNDISKSQMLSAVSVRDPADVSSRRFSDVAFTGQIYIYHELEMEPDQIAGLVALYKSKGLILQLRSRTYQVMRSLSESALK